MYDSSFNKLTLGRMLITKDFFDWPIIKDDHVRRVLIEKAIESANTSFNNLNPLVTFKKKGKSIYKIRRLSDALVIRKLCANLIQASKVQQQNRDAIVTNLSKLVAEGVPYRIYRLDIKNFYESFSHELVIKKINALVKLNPTSKKIISDLINLHAGSGGQGLPRGLAISASLSELLMSDFDNEIRQTRGVYFYARYVDDILILTNANENETEFKNNLRKLLPDNLKLNNTKQSVRTCPDRVNPLKTTAPPEINISFDYLGYNFEISKPYTEKGSNKKPTDYFRTVKISIASSKIKKIKFRIARSFLEFSKTNDFTLLKKRIKFLTTNYKVRDASREKYKMAGIYYSYPLLTPGVNNGIEEIDKFLANAIHSKNGRIFSKTSSLLSKQMKKELLGHSFSQGYKSRCLVHFNPTTMHDIQECWTHE